jgi:hypothetical protein
VSDAKTPELDALGRAKPPYLIPLWTWLAALTVSVALFFHAASQGSPIWVEFGVKVDGEMKYGRAGMWGVLFLAPCVLALYSLTLVWMRRNFVVREQAGPGWDRLPAPELWKLPSSDGVTRYLRVGVWLLVFVLPMVSLVHLAKKHFATEFYQSCAELADTQLAGCLKFDGKDLKGSGAPADKKDAYREFAGPPKDRFQRLRDHLSLKYLDAPSYWDHSFYLVKPSADTYFPGLQGWLYVAAILLAFWLWLRIVLSALAGRVVLRWSWRSLTRFLTLELWRPSDHKIDPIPTGRPFVRVGVIGHRRLDETQKCHVEKGFDVALASCRREGYGLRVVSGMASGADRIAVDWALKQDNAELLVVLPCEATAFRDGSWVRDADPFNAQIAAIRTRTEDTEAAKNGRGAALLELSGVMPRVRDPQAEDESLPKAVRQRAQARVDARDAPNRAPRIAAHRHKISVLLRQCEFLIAAMDLSDPGKPGGTRECVEEALALGTPVLVLDIDSGTLGLISRVDQLRPGGLPADGLSALGDLIDAHLWPVDNDGMPKDLGKLKRVYRTAEPSKLSRFSPWWGHFERLFAGPKVPGQKAEKDPPSYFTTLRNRITTDQRQLMAAYRGSFVLAYLLGLIAVVMALTIAMVFWVSDGKAVGTMLLLTAPKLIAILWIGLILRRSQDEKVNEVAIALRYISERLRIMPALVKLGSARMDLLHQTQRMGEPARVAEDLCRRIALSHIRSEFETDPQVPGALQSLRKLQNEQFVYNTEGHRRSHTMHHRLEKSVKAASLLVQGIVVADVLLLIYKWWTYTPHAGVGKSALSTLGLSLILLTALLPAIMAALNALTFQSQAEQLAERQLDLARTFKQHLNHTDQLKADFDANRLGEPCAAAVLVEAERSAAVLAEEVAEWAVMSRQSLKES